MASDILTEVPKISVKLGEEVHQWAKIKASIQHQSLMEYVRLLIERDIEALSLRDLKEKYKRRKSEDAATRRT